MSSGWARAQRIRASMPELFADRDWRVSPDPFPLSQKLVDSLEKLGHRLWKFQRACDLLYRLSVKGKQPGWIAGLLDAGKPRHLVELGRSKAFLESLPAVIRPDLVLTEEGFTIAELDNVPGGIGVTAWLNMAYSREEAVVLGGADGMLEGFRRVLSRGKIVVSEESAMYLPEMKWLAAQLRERFVSDVSVTDSAAGQTWEGRVYRFFELFDWENLACFSDLADSAANGSADVTPPLKPWIEEKLWFALFWLRPLHDYWRRELGESHFAELQKVIPYTWLVNPEPLPVHAVLPRLEAQSWDDVKHFTQKERDLVLKVSGFSERAWGSRGVFVGSDLSQAEWSALVDRALAEYESSPWILQEFHKAAVVEHPWADPQSQSIVLMKGRVRLCPYYFLGGEKPLLGGVLATVCPEDKKLLHGMADAILTCVSAGEPGERFAQHVRPNAAGSV